MSKFTVGQKVSFPDEPPYTVMAVSERYVIVSRKLNRRADADLLWYQVRMGAYFSFTSAYNALKDSPVYSVLDLKEGVRSSDDLVFGVYDYFDVVDCELSVHALEAGEIGLSGRNGAVLKINDISVG
jgi:hypothetical protein